MKSIKSVIRQSLATVYFASNHFLRRLQGTVLFLMYHRVLSEKDLNRNVIQPGMYVQDDVFERQMEFLKDHFQILSLSELLGHWTEETSLQDKRYCVITFDDGWLDNYLYAYPILKRHNIPATIFLATALIGTNQWFWPEKVIYLLQHLSDSVLRAILNDSPDIQKLLFGSGNLSRNGERRIEWINSVVERCKTLPEEKILELIERIKTPCGLIFPDERLILSWQEVEQMSQNNITFGSHSCTHRILTRLPLNEVKKELEESLQVLLSKKLHHVPVFCYPNGEYNQEIQALVKGCGYQAGVTTQFGFQSYAAPQDYFRIKRIAVHNDVSLTIPLFLWRISGFEQAFLAPNPEI